jgi:hypothetical protein
MNNEPINPQLGQEFRKYITAPEARKAFDLLIARSARPREFRCEFKLKGAVRDFRYYDAISVSSPTPALSIATACCFMYGSLVSDA